SPASLRSAPSPAVRARGYKTTYPSSESCAAAAYVPIDPVCPSPALRALRQTLRRVASAASRVRVYPSRSAWPIAQGRPRPPLRVGGVPAKARSHCSFRKPLLTRLAVLGTLLSVCRRARNAGEGLSAVVAVKCLVYGGDDPKLVSPC